MTSSADASLCMHTGRSYLERGFLKNNYSLSCHLPRFHSDFNCSPARVRCHEAKLSLLQCCKQKTTFARGGPPTEGTQMHPRCVCCDTPSPVPGSRTGCPGTMYCRASFLAI